MQEKRVQKRLCQYRGIFRVTILRSILDKLIYNDEYTNIDEHLSDSNVGARRNRNIRDNIFVINVSLNHVRKKEIKRHRCNKMQKSALISYLQKNISMTCMTMVSLMTCCHFCFKKMSMLKLQFKWHQESQGP